MKGADVVMAGIVRYNDWLEEEVSVTRRGKPRPRRHVLEAVPLHGVARRLPHSLFAATSPQNIAA